MKGMSKMSLLKNIRWYVYWALDFLKGSPVGRYYRQIKQDYELGTSADETRAKVQALIKHAVKTTNFYKDYPPNIDLSDLPVVNKSVYKDRYDDFISSEYRDARTNRVMYTSGSTGTPFAMIQDRRKALHNTAASIYLLTLGNYYIGTRQAFIRLWVDANRKSKFQAFRENIIMVDTTKLHDDNIMDMLIVVQKKKVKSIFSYATTLKLIYQYMDNHAVKPEGIKLTSLISTSEVLSENARASLSKLFACPVRSLYSNEENGIMAIQDTDGNRYYLDSSGYIFESLKLDSDEPADEGEMGRLVITDLYNYAFPVLRYENGDLGIVYRENVQDRYRVFIDELSGRKTDLIFDSKGRAISQHSISIHMWGISGITQYQFAQVGEKEYQLRINPESGEIDENKVRERLLPLLGSDADLQIIYVDEIPILNSGKRKEIVNLYHQQPDNSPGNISSQTKGRD